MVYFRQVHSQVGLVTTSLSYSLDSTFPSCVGGKIGASATSLAPSCGKTSATHCQMVKGIG